MPASHQQRLPWHQPQWSQIEAALSAQRLPHALLLSGAEGLGKHAFAHTLATSLLCRSPGATGSASCGQCRSCAFIQADTHPDLRWLTLAEEANSISVDQVRSIIDYLHLKPQEGRRKVVIITPAESMTINASNALLKTLEEPPDDHLIMLLSQRPLTLPATLRSRCQALLFHTPAAQIATAWLSQQEIPADECPLLLAVADGAPLRALQLASTGGLKQRQAIFDAFIQLIRGQQPAHIIAAQWLKLGAKESLYWLESWIVDILRLAAIATPPKLNNPDYIKELTAIHRHISSHQLYRLLDKNRQVRQLLLSGCNKELMFEELALSWIN